MKALLSLTAGPPETLEISDIPPPVLGRGEVLITVFACALNFPDLLVIEDRYQYRPARPFAPGSEVAGIVEAIGDGVSGWSPGDRVVAQMYHGGLAEKAIVEAGKLAALPANRSFIEGASLVLPYGTAYHALTDRARLAAGETLLVLGASGSVGRAAVEVGKALGARVVAAVSSQAKAEAARAAGADEIMIYPRPPFTPEERQKLAQAFKAHVGAGGADVICDPVGGPYSEAALRAIGWDGRFLAIGFTAGIASLPLNLLLMKRCQAIGIFWGPYMERFPDHYRQQVQALFALWDAGRIQPCVSRTYPFEQAAQALRELADGTTLGRIVIGVAG